MYLSRGSVSAVTVDVGVVGITWSAQNKHHGDHLCHTFYDGVDFQVTATAGCDEFHALK